jgi:hypothetical protein
VRCIFYFVKINPNVHVKIKGNWMKRDVYSSKVCIYFSVAREKMVYLVCNKGVSMSKEYNLSRHYQTVYKEKLRRLDGRLGNVI